MLPHSLRLDLSAAAKAEEQRQNPLRALSGSIKFVLVSLYHILYPWVTEHPFCKLHYNVSSSAQPCLVQWGLI